MSSQKALSTEEETLLSYLLRAANYRAGSVAFFASEIADSTGIDTSRLTGILLSLSAQGLVRVTNLPEGLEDAFVDKAWNDLDMLDIRHVEHDIVESEYVSCRLTLANQLEAFPHYAEPLSPAEAARLFQDRERVLQQLLCMTRSSQSLNPETLTTKLLSITARLLPYRHFVHKRIAKLRSTSATKGDILDEKRMRLLLLYSQVGLSQLTPLEEIGQDLLDELDLLRARSLVGEISEADLRHKEEICWNEISTRMTPQLPDKKAYNNWMRNLNLKLDALRSLRLSGIQTKDMLQTVFEDLSEDIALLESFAKAATWQR